jgi:transcriptional regulator with XRE-family HTH domain
MTLSNSKREKDEAKMETFASRLIRLRHEHGMTQRDVAEAVGVPLSTYREWEYGRRIQGENIYVKLAEVFEVNLKTLLTGSDQTQSPNGDLLKKVETAIEQLKDVRSLLMSL